MPVESGRVEYLNPAGMHHNPAFTQVVAVSGAVRTVYIGTQTGVDASGHLVGPGDVAAQTVQAPFEAAMRWWANRPNPPANTVVYVSSLVPPQFLIGIEAVAVVPEVT
jgi:enamine deaminase RidA (YjgF/YER057c/UK114 family)